MKNLFYLVLISLTVLSCTKPKDNYYDNPGVIVRYEGYVSPYLVVSQNDNMSGPLTDTISYLDWREIYEDEGLLVDTSSYSQLAGSIWVITDYWVSGHIHNTPNDTIYFINGNTYELHNVNTYPNPITGLRYDLMPDPNGISLSFRIENIPTFGYSGWFSGILPWYSTSGDEFLVQKFTNELNTSEIIKSVKFKKIN